MYDGTIPCHIVIQKEEVWPAFSDPEDGPKAEDKIMPCVSVWYENPGGGCTFDKGGGYYNNVEKAKAGVEGIVSGPIE